MTPLGRASTHVSQILHLIAVMFSFIVLTPGAHYVSRRCLNKSEFWICRQPHLKDILLFRSRSPCSRLSKGKLFLFSLHHLQRSVRPLFAFSNSLPLTLHTTLKNGPDNHSSTSGFYRYLRYPDNKAWATATIAIPSGTSSRTRIYIFMLIWPSFANE